jgi:hypothetical protein
MSWPLPASTKLVLAPPRARLPRIVWVLVVAAFFCGGLLSAAGFAVGWRHQAQRGTSAESQLVAATATVHSLRAQLASARADITTLRGTTDALSATKSTLTHSAARLRAQLAAAQRSVTAVSAAAAPLASDLDRLRNELRALSSYVGSTPAGQLDAGYVQAQLAYVTKTVDGFSAAVAAVAAPGH